MTEHRALHPATVHIPMGAWALAFPLDLAAHFSAPHFWFVASWLSVLGTAVAQFTWLIGFLDASRAARIYGNGVLIAGHAAFVSLATCLYGVGSVMRLDALTPSASPDWIVTGLDGAGLVTLLIGGWLGGKLTYARGVGVVIEGTDYAFSDGTPRTKAGL
ncbi:MAG: DUF2231 domain-containing protein [Myxococcota bacterium]